VYEMEIRNSSPVLQVARRLHNYAWLAIYFPYFCAVLKRKHQFVKLLPVFVSGWHLATKYFRARDAAGNEFFIKTDSSYATLENEASLSRKLYNTGVNTPELVAVDSCCNKKYMVYRYVSGMRLADLMEQALWLNERRASALVTQLIEMLDGLYAARVVHRDLTPGNILISQSARNEFTSYLIDFSFSVDLDDRSLLRSIPYWVERELGGAYRMKEGVWDDAYSVLKILREVEGKLEETLSVGTNEVEKKLGRIRYEWKLP